MSFILDERLSLHSHIIHYCLTLSAKIHPAIAYTNSIVLVYVSILLSLSFYLDVFLCEYLFVFESLFLYLSGTVALRICSLMSEGCITVTGLLSLSMSLCLIEWLIFSVNVDVSLYL